MDDSFALIIGKVLAVLGLVAANGFFVASEFALVGMRRSRIEELAAQGHGAAGALRRATDNLDSNLAATQLGVTISSLALGWIGEPALARLIEPAFAALPGGWAVAGAHAIAVGVAFALITVFHIVLGELAPKSLALQRPEQTAMFIVRPLGLFLALFRPVIFMLNALGNSALRLFGLEPGQGEARLHSTQELKLLVAESKNAGLVETSQQEVVDRAFGMAEVRVRTIMTPRLDVYWINADSDHDKLLRSVRDCPHEHMVVAHGALDKFIGVLRKQDLLNAHLDGQPIDPVAAVREPLVVHDGATVLQVFETFKERPVQMALVVDEYGVVQGIVLVDGTTPVDKALLELGLPPVEPDSDYHTLAGFALSRFAHVPSAGESFEWQGWRFEVVDMDGHRIDKLSATPGAPAEAVQAPNSDSHRS